MPQANPHRALRRRLLMLLAKGDITNVATAALTLDVQRPSVSRVLAQLQDEGFAQKHDHIWSLTSEGRALVMSWSQDDPPPSPSGQISGGNLALTPLPMSAFDAQTVALATQAFRDATRVQDMMRPLQSILSQISRIPPLAETMMQATAHLPPPASWETFHAITRQLASDSLRSVLNSQVISASLMSEFANLGALSSVASVVHDIGQMNFGLGATAANLEAILHHTQYPLGNITQLVASLAPVTRTLQSYLADASEMMRLQPFTYPTGPLLVAPTRTASTLVHTIRIAVAEEDSVYLDSFDGGNEAEPWLIQVQQVDQVISRCGPSFEQMWRGSWTVLRSNSPDRCRQAAHSGRELLNQLLHHHAPDEAFTAEELEQAPQHRPTRKMRIRRILAGRAGATDFVEATARTLDEMYGRLSGISHDHAVQPTTTVSEVSGFLLTMGGLLWVLFGDLPEQEPPN